MTEDIALLKESRNQIAVRHGLPPIGAMMVNQHGIEWLVDGHLNVPTLATITRRGVDRDDSEDPLDLYPVIIPQNLSPLLAQFIAETSRCTSKSIMPVDTMPSLRPSNAHPESYAVDGQTSPYRIVVFLDAAHVHETILAHEIGHVWIDLVDDCEDYRMLNDLSNTARVFQWTSIQSFILDMKVNEVLREKGFDMSIIAGHVEEALANVSLAVLSGYRPPKPREAAFLAMTLASAMLDQETGAMDTLQNLDVAAMVCQRDLPDVYELACQFAGSVRQHGYHNRDSIRKAIDACASLSFQYVGEPLNLAQDVVEETPEECLDDKYPQWFPGLPIAAKLEIGKAMARQRIPAEAEWQLSYSPGGSVQIQFRQESGSWTPPVILHHAHRLPHVPSFAGRQPAMQKGNPIMNKSVMHPSTHNSVVPQTPIISPALPSAIQPALPFSPIYPGTPTRRSYSPGLAVFLSRVRLEEQLGGEHPYGYAYNNPINYIDPDGNKPQWGWNGWWVQQNQQLLHDCISAGLKDPNYSGLNMNKVSQMIRCIIGCELDNLPKDYDIMQPDPGYPTGGVGPCRLTGTPEYGGFTYPNNNWRKDACDNIKAGIALLCFDIKHRNKPPNSYTLPGDWSGDKPCYNRCMAPPKKNPPKKRPPKK